MTKKRPPPRLSSRNTLPPKTKRRPSKRLSKNKANLKCKELKKALAKLSAGFDTMAHKYCLAKDERQARNRSIIFTRDTWLPTRYACVGCITTLTPYVGTFCSACSSPALLFNCRSCSNHVREKGETCAACRIEDMDEGDEGDDDFEGSDGGTYEDGPPDSEGDPSAHPIAT
jgi:hypothetical protein